MFISDKSVAHRKYKPDPGKNRYCEHDRQSHFSGMFIINKMGQKITDNSKNKTIHAPSRRRETSVMGGIEMKKKGTEKIHGESGTKPSFQLVPRGYNRNNPVKTKRKFISLKLYDCNVCNIKSVFDDFSICKYSGRN